MREQVIEIETKRLAREKGFELSQRVIISSPHPKESNGSFTDDRGITQSLLQKWLREEHHLIVIVAYQYEYDSTPYSYWIYKERESLPINQWINDLKTYEEALEIGLQQALKLI